MRGKVWTEWGEPRGAGGEARAVEADLWVVAGQWRTKRAGVGWREGLESRHGEGDLACSNDVGV